LREELETINAEINRANNLRHQIDHLETEKYSYTKQISKLEAVLEANLEVQGQFDVSWLNNKNEELSTELKKLNNEITNLKSENNRDQEIATEKKLNSLQENLIRLNKELENLNKELRQDSKNEGQNEALSKLIDEFLKQLEEIEQETDLQQLKKLINVAKNDFQQKITKLINGLDDDKLKQIKKIQTEIISLNEDKQQTQEILNAERLRLSTINERLRLLEDRKSQTEKEIADIKAKLEKAQVKFDASEIEAEKELINKRLASLNEEIKNIEIKLVEFNTAQEKEKGLMYECQKNIQSLQQEINTILAELNNLRVEAARQETKLEDLEANIRNDELEINDIRDYKITTTDIAINRWQKEIANSKLQLEQIGGIDPETEKEFAETKERYDFLTNQTTDLHQAIKSLEEIIYELDSNIKSRFDVEFKVISEKFNEYFKVLFNGGSAKISKIMIDESEEDKQKATEHNENGHHAHLEGLSAADAETKKANDEKLKRIKFLRKHNAVGLAGIDIQATPPGKKIQTVSMLSGGERALTAIALICAIISANPSPFVVLDEADAALDEANSERLAKILDDLSNKTQFIVITHNRASMRRASILYGVTMEENGVSKLLSVKLDDLKNKNIF
jgi:chromosome segregation protein